MKVTNKSETINKPKIDFRLEAKPVPEQNKAVVYLYGDIRDERPRDWWTDELLEGDYIIPAEVRELFDGIQEKEIDLHINSYGGSVFASVSIYNYLLGLDKTINTFNDGICASGASLIFMAGQKTFMPRNTNLMIHRASSYGWGNCNDLRKLADTLEKLDNSTVLETYKTRFKGTDEELINLIDEETWITAEEAKEFGLCDEITELKKEEPKETNNLTEEEITNGINLMKNFARLKI